MDQKISLLTESLSFSYNTTLYFCHSPLWAVVFYWFWKEVKFIRDRDLEHAEDVMDQFAIGRRANAADYFEARDRIRTQGRAEGPNPSIADLMRQQPGRGHVGKRIPQE